MTQLKCIAIITEHLMYYTYNRSTGVETSYISFHVGSKCWHHIHRCTCVWFLFKCYCSAVCICCCW